MRNIIKKHYNELKMKQHNLKSFNGFEKTNRSVGHLFSFLLPQKLNRRTDVVLAYNSKFAEVAAHSGSCR